MSTKKLTVKEALAAIAKLVNIKFDEAFTNVKCTDGTILKWSGEMKEGTAVMVVTEDGNEMPAPDKTYEVEDGSKITTVGGLITAIEQKPAENPTEELNKAKELMSKFAENTIPDAASMAIMMKAVMNYCFGWELEKTAREAAVNEAIAVYKQGFKAIEELITSQDERIAAHEEKFGTIEKKVSEGTESFTQTFNEIKKIVEEIAEEPAADPLQKTGQFGKKTKQEPTAAERLHKVLKEKNKNS